MCLYVVQVVRFLRPASPSLLRFVSIPYGRNIARDRTPCPSIQKVYTIIYTEAVSIPVKLTADTAKESLGDAGRLYTKGRNPTEK
jgi:hypothetical protein